MHKLTTQDGAQPNTITRQITCNRNFGMGFNIILSFWISLPSPFCFELTHPISKVYLQNLHCFLLPYIMITFHEYTRSKLDFSWLYATVQTFKRQHVHKLYLCLGWSIHMVLWFCILHFMYLQYFTIYFSYLISWLLFMNTLGPYQDSVVCMQPRRPL